jgi:hypothetical protein
MDRESVMRVLREYDALLEPEADAQLEAVRTAVLAEDVFGVSLSDAEIDPAVLADPSAVADLVVRLRESR